MLIGVESKRFEPFRGHKPPSLSKAYDRDVWGKHMAPFTAMRDALRDWRERFEFLDATQLVKHAFELVADGNRKHKAAGLAYLHAKPAALGGRPIPESAHRQHRAEIARFAAAVAGAEVAFRAISHRDWLAPGRHRPIPWACTAGPCWSGSRLRVFPTELESLSFSVRSQLVRPSSRAQPRDLASTCTRLVVETRSLRAGLAALGRDDGERLDVASPNTDSPHSNVRVMFSCCNACG